MSLRDITSVSLLSKIFSKISSSIDLTDNTDFKLVEILSGCNGLTSLGVIKCE